MPRLCVSGIGYSINDADLRTYFSRFGNVAECRLATDSASGESRGYAFISFADNTATDRCLQEPSHSLNERKMTVYPITQENCASTSISTKRILISYLGVSDVTESDVRSVFDEYGTITSVEIAQSKMGKPLFYCTVVYSSEVEAEHCLSRQHCIRGRSVFVRRAVRKEDVKRAEQMERERADRLEKSKHGYAGYSSHQAVDASQYFSSVPSLLGGTSAVEPQSATSAHPYADYGGYTAVSYQSIAVSAPKKTSYEEACAQAGAAGAYNYNENSIVNIDRSALTDSGIATGADSSSSKPAKDKFRGYGYT